MGRVVVVGGINQDVTVQIDRRPGGGETVVGLGPVTGPGGKGANQAVAAAAAGAAVALCAVVGDDAAGSEELSGLTAAGVEVAHVRVVDGAATGRALILVTPDGENSIVVGAGANALLRPHDVRAAVDERADVVLVQTEPGAAPAEAAAEAAARCSARLVVNAAPAAGLSSSLLRACDPLIVNEHEARDLLAEAGVVARAKGAEGAEGAGLAAALKEHLGCGSVVVSLGADGAVAAAGESLELVGAPSVVALDTTGAGDVLVGVIAARLSQGVDLVDAVRDACDRAATAVTHEGARGYLSAD